MQIFSTFFIGSLFFLQCFILGQSRVFAFIIPIFNSKQFKIRNSLVTSNEFSIAKVNQQHHQQYPSHSSRCSSSSCMSSHSNDCSCSSCMHGRSTFRLDASQYSDIQGGGSINQKDSAHHSNMCSCSACNQSHSLFCTCSLCLNTASGVRKGGQEGKGQLFRRRVRNLMSLYASTSTDSDKNDSKTAAPGKKLLSGQTIFNPTKGQGQQKVFWDHLGQHVDLPDWSPQEKNVGIIYDIVNDDIHDRLEDVYELFGNQIDLVSTYDGIFRFKYHGQVRNLLGMQAWCKSEIEKLGTVPEMKELRFETEEQADPFWDYSF